MSWSKDLQRFLVAFSCFALLTALFALMRKGLGGDARMIWGTVVVFVGLIMLIWGAVVGIQIGLAGQRSRWQSLQAFLPQCRRLVVKAWAVLQQEWTDGIMRTLLLLIGLLGVPWCGLIFLLQMTAVQAFSTGVLLVVAVQVTGYVVWRRVAMNF
ncbi:hypothetical protein HY933_01175 [Candidatus Falkowbacteria bacterium]|nr:hypothetical protein [Candidatus Falkowbacteria bacterium]